MSETWIQDHVLEPMKINKPKSADDLSKKINSGKYFGEIKKDGALYQLVKDEDGAVHLFSRTTSKKTGFFVDKIDNVPHIKAWAESSALPNETILLGEIYYPHQTSKDVVKVMGCLPQKAIERQKDNPIHYYIFDCLMWNGISLLDKGNLQRYTTLDSILVAEPDIWDSWLEVPEIFTSHLEKHLEEAFAAGEEGMVFKDIYGLYQAGKRPTYNIKAKTEDTIDAIIDGFVEPEKLYTGKELRTWNYWEDANGMKYMAGGGGKNPDDVPVTKPYFYNWKMGFQLAAYDKDKMIPIGSVTSGMTDELREDCAKHPENYLGRVVEIQCMSTDKDALSLRHPRLVRVRSLEDKAAKDCTVDDIFS